MLFVSTKSAKYSEILTAVILSNTFYCGTDLYVGDKEKVTDIYTKDKSVGIEVVQAEYLSDFLLDSYSKLTSKDYSFINSNKKLSKTKVLSWSYNTDLDNKFVMEQFAERVRDKIKKLNNGNYKKIKKEVNLVLISYMRVKDKKDAQNFVKAYIRETKDAKLKFSKVFLIFSTGIYYMTDNEIISFVEFVGDEFLEYQLTAKKLIQSREKQDL